MPMLGMNPMMSEEERRRLAMMAQSGGMAQQPISMTRGAQQMLASAPKIEQQKPKSYWQGGDKFGWRDAAAGALSAIGDGLSTWANGPSAGGATQGLIGGRLSAIQQAKEAQAAAQRAQQEEAARQRMRGEKLEDLRGELGVRKEFANPEVKTTEDKFGNRWRVGEDGRMLDEKPVFVELSPRVYIQGDRAVEIQNPWLDGRGGGQGLPTVKGQADYDALPPGAQYRDPQGNIRTKGGAASNGGGSFR